MLYCQHQKNDFKSSQGTISRYFIITYLRYLQLSFYDSRRPLNKFCLLNSFSEATRTNVWIWTSYWYWAIQKVCTFWRGREVVLQNCTKTYKGSERVIQKGMHVYDFLKSHFHFVFSYFCFLLHQCGKENRMTVTIVFSKNVIIW